VLFGCLTLPQEKQRMGMIMFWLGEFETGGSCGWGVVKRCRSEGHQTMLRWDSCGECLQRVGLVVFAYRSA
jgi:hypothetical protein